MTALVFMFFGQSGGKKVTDKGRGFSVVGQFCQSEQEVCLYIQSGEIYEAAGFYGAFAHSEKSFCLLGTFEL